MGDKSKSMLQIMQRLDYLCCLRMKEEENEEERSLQSIHWICDSVVLQRMIDRGFRIMESMNCEQRTELIQKAVKNKDLSLIRIMMENGLKFYESFESGENWWLLGKVVEVCEEEPEYEEIVKYLLDQGCPSDNFLTDVEGWYDAVESRPLYHAVCKGLWDIASLLISAGADPTYSEIQNEFGACLDPRFIGVMKEHDLDFHLKVPDSFLNGLFGGSEVISRNAEHFREKQIPMIKRLLEEGMDVTNVVDCRIHEWFSVATRCFSSSPIKDEDYLCEVLQLMLDQGVDVNDPDYDDQSALYRAAENHQHKIFKLLLENGADINAADRHGRTPLLALTYKPDGLDMERFKFFLQAGADVNVTWKEETETPYILSYFLNDNIKYKEQLMYLLNNSSIKIPLRLNNLQFIVLQPMVLYKLVQVGLSGYVILCTLLIHAIQTNTQKGYYLARQVCPNVRILFSNPGLAQPLLSCVINYKEEIMHDIRNAPSLVTWSICAIRCHLLNTSNISILPRLRALSAEIPADLRPMLTLDCYMTNDCNRFPIQQQHETKLYEHNRQIMEFSLIQEDPSLSE